MKLLTILSIILLILFLGCDQESGITSPLHNPDEMTLFSISTEEPMSNESDNSHHARIVDEDSQSYPPGADTIFIIQDLLPAGLPNLDVVEVIDGNVGGLLEIDYEYTGDDYTVKIKAKLDIPVGAFSGTEEITMLLNNEDGTILFYPHMVFNEPLEFDLKYEGIDVSDIDSDSTDFIFQNYNGSIEQIDYRKIKVNYDKGYIHLEKAELHHFSRYGFVNREL